jgi:hypothetical protein
MKYTRTVLGATAVLAVCLAAPGLAAQREILEKVGGWQLTATKDAMTDKLSCTGFYDGKPTVQLNAESFYVSLRGRGGVQGVMVRFDDRPAGSMRLPTDIEKRLSHVQLTRSEFTEMQQAQRVRIEVITILNQIVLEDVNLQGTAAALDVLRGDKCNSKS